MTDNLDLKNFLVMNNSNNIYKTIIRINSPPIKNDAKMSTFLYICNYFKSEISNLFPFQILPIT